MTLQPGTRLGPYEIGAAIGAGGMGEVYRAHDRRLRRDVAIKVLPDGFARDPDRLARFEREAHALASLNHPNIAQIYGVEESNGVVALALELVEGPTLAERIERGPFQIHESVSITRQLAEALAAAHEKGIVHRDLKPANIKITPDGVVKVLDFGLATAIAGPSLHGDRDEPATRLVTQAGLIVGTPAYMSPEQARGISVDTRTDIWAFGCVLYEMLTGTRAFAGATMFDTIAAVLEREPDWQALPPSAQRFASLLRRCLDKDMKRRLRDIGDVGLWLDDDGAAGSSVRAAAASGPGRSRAIPVAAALLLGLVAGGAAIALTMRWRTAVNAPPLTRFAITSSGDGFTADPVGPNVAIAPDGSRVVFTAIRAGAQVLMIRRFDQVNAQVLNGSEGGFAPFFSPDGKEIGFAAFSELKRMPVDGGTPSVICRVNPTFAAAAWGSDNDILLSQDFALFHVPASGGKPESFALPDVTHDESDFRAPTILPGARAVIYTVGRRSGDTRLVIRRKGEASAVPLIESGYDAHYLTSGHLLYAQGERVMAIHFDLGTLRVSGSPVVVQEGVFVKKTESIANIAAGDSGTMVYLSGLNAGDFGRLVWFDRGGTRLSAVVDQPLEYPRNPRLSPDGRRLVLTVGPGGRGDVWVYDLAGGARPLKLTFQDHNTFPIWSPDGSTIAFMRQAGGTNRILTIPANGSTVTPAPLAVPQRRGFPMSWTADGTVLLHESQGLSVLNSKSGQMRSWLETPFEQSAGRLSPDEKWLANTSTQTGKSEVWVRPFPGPGGTTRISADGGIYPVWSRDGKELFYEFGGKIFSARVTSTTPDLHIDPPRVLFAGAFIYDDTDANLNFYDVNPDGRLLMIERTNPPSHAVPVVLQHLDGLLTR